MPPRLTPSANARVKLREFSRTSQATAMREPAGLWERRNCADASPTLRTT